MTAALIITAGKTKNREKFGPEKKIGSISAAERLVLLIQQAGIERIVVVCNKKDRMKKLVPNMNLIFLESDGNSEMLEYIKQGLEFLYDKCSEVLISYVDVPLFSVNTVKTLCKSPGDVCVPSFNGRCGHPVLLRHNGFEKIIHFNGDGGLKGAILESGLGKNIVEVQDSGIRSNIGYENPEESIVKGHDVGKLRASFKFRISKEQVFYGPGVHQLLQLVQEFGSLSDACRHMGISYGKGRKMIYTMEQQLGISVLETRQGGKDGGYSHLTNEARKIMSAYKAFKDEAEIEMQKLFEKFFLS